MILLNTKEIVQVALLIGIAEEHGHTINGSLFDKVDGFLDLLARQPGLEIPKEPA